MSTSAASSNNIASALIAEMEIEAVTTRKCLERIPSEKFDWKPHEKSFTMRQLAVHIAEMHGWTMPTLMQPELDFAKFEYKPAEPSTTEELVALLDKNVSEAVSTLRQVSDDKFMEQWSLKNGDITYFTMPRIAVMRSMVMNHIVHHRGQLTVYLRENDIPVPSIYGPSADEGS